MTKAKTKEIIPLFGVVIDGNRHPLVGNEATAKALVAAAIAEGHKAALFGYSETEINAKNAEEAEHQFLAHGMQYYIAARSLAVLVGALMMPVCGNLYHHAVEMLLKAGLSRNPLYPLEVLASRRFNHNLPKLWTAFKADFSFPTLVQFNAVIPTLDKWHEIRHPDKLLQTGALMEVVWIEDTHSSAPSSPPRYAVDGATIDKFVSTIFAVLERLPGVYTWLVKSNPTLRELLAKYNTEAGHIWPP